mmetsp:Transcript_8857/g.16813  ORF Transcript_8857/g.16813 Transcript_8857/m.16813 type:complete len:224 (+) Transcript_8857:481-1152(+)
MSSEIFNSCELICVDDAITTRQILQDLRRPSEHWHRPNSERMVNLFCNPRCAVDGLVAQREHVRPNVRPLVSMECHWPVRKAFIYPWYCGIRICPAATGRVIVLRRELRDELLDPGRPPIELVVVACSLHDNDLLHLVFKGQGLHPPQMALHVITEIKVRVERNPHVRLRICTDNQIDVITLFGHLGRRCGIGHLVFKRTGRPDLAFDLALPRAIGSILPFWF